jgi:radical SAM superfamily enzyme YgiQ (UPF0313 family)
MGWDEVKAARQRLAREEGVILKDWGGRLPIALIYPNSYYVGMSNLGLHTLYRYLNSYPDIVAERAFRDKGQAVISLESQRPLSDFAVLAFTVSYELDYFNVVQILKASGLPLYAAERNERQPLVIAGGPCIIANPMPLAPFFDALCIGEAEAILPAMLPVISGGISGKRDELLRALAQLPGVYVPRHLPNTPVKRQWAPSLDEAPVSSVILTPDTEFGDLYLIEVERGCNWGCRFCLTRNAFRPMRCHPVDKIIAQAERGLKYRRRLGLVGAMVSDHPQIEELLIKLRQMGAELSVSSLRMKSKSHIVMREMAKGSARTIALAPEAGSARLRRVIKKDISEDDILQSIDQIAGAGIKQLKLYFMFGLPSETDEDIAALIDLTLKGKQILDKKQTGIRLVLNLAPFVPKAGTPFQWLPMAKIATLKHRLSFIKNKLQPKGIKVKAESPAWSQIQAVLSRGDAKLAEVLANWEEFSLAGWRRAVAMCQLDIDFYAHQRWDINQKLPWDIIDSGTKTAHLKRELESALAQY